MVRHIIVGNGDMLVCMDRHASIRDFYYPYIGQENHVSSNIHRTGIWVDNTFSWVNADEWELDITYKQDSLVSDVSATHKKLGVKLRFNETVLHEKNIFLRNITVENTKQIEREIKVFFAQQFTISETNIGDTVYYDPKSNSIINYKGRRYFLIGGQTNGNDFDEYTTGVAGIPGKEGTHKDAEDGTLTKHSIEHGSVDSTIGFTIQVSAGGTKTFNYWICVGKDHREVCELRNEILTRGAETLLQETETHWKTWVEKNLLDFEDLGEKEIELFKRSLLIVRAQTDNRGAIIAANDSHIFRRKEDTYSYMWPRDGALISRSLDRVGHFDITTKFFEFCANVISEEGYLLHKYRPDGSVGSSWHSWLKGNKLQLPIQEDETALVLDALRKHYEAHKDETKIKRMYKTFIKKAADFLATYRDENTGLPKETYDLWEEKLGIHTFTCATVYAGLQAAAAFAKEFGTKADITKYQTAATEIREGILEHLYDKENKLFLKRIYYDNEGTLIKDYTIDASTMYGLFEYEILELEDPRLQTTIQQTIKTLWNNEKTGGMIRYDGDKYYKTNEQAPPNPWYIPTLWLAEYYITKAQHKEDLEEAKKIIEWAAQHTLPSGSMSEQLHPQTGEALSVAPLTWSHAGYIIAVVKYCDKKEELRRKEG